MQLIKVLACTVPMALLAACSTPQERAAKAQERSYEAQEDVARERLKLVDQYKDCVSDAAGDAQKIEMCDTYLRAAEALQ